MLVKKVGINIYGMSWFLIKGLGHGYQGREVA